MNYYNEITKKVKDYSKNKSDLESYYEVGKILFNADRHYGEGIIKEYSKKLTNELLQNNSFFINYFAIIRLILIFSMKKYKYVIQ